MTRKEAISRLKEGEPFSEIYDPVWNEALDMAISALSVPERKKGEWVEREVKSREGTYLECSRCGCLPPTLECADRIIFMRSNFCPDCGADMRT